MAKRAKKAGADPRRLETGRRIAKARKDADLSQSELAAKVGVESQTISLYERGRLSPGAEPLLLIADACAVDPRWLACLANDLKATGS